MARSPKKEMQIALNTGVPNANSNPKEHDGDWVDVEDDDENTSPCETSSDIGSNNDLESDETSESEKKQQNPLAKKGKRVRQEKKNLEKKSLKIKWAKQLLELLIPNITNLYKLPSHTTPQFQRLLMLYRLRGVAERLKLKIELMKIKGVTIDGNVYKVYFVLTTDLLSLKKISKLNFSQLCPYCLTQRKRTIRMFIGNRCN